MEPAIASNNRLSGCPHLSALLNQAPPLEWGKPLAVLGAGWMEKFSKCGRGSKKEGGTLKNTGIYRQETGKHCAHCRNLKQRKHAWYGSTTVSAVFCACRTDQFPLHFAVDNLEQHEVAVNFLKSFKCLQDLSFKFPIRILVVSLLREGCSFEFYIDSLQVCMARCFEIISL